MNIVFFDDLEQDIVSINFVIPIGTKTIYKGKKNNFAHLIEHLLFHGHPELTQYELMLQIEQMGGLVNAGTNGYYTELFARVHKKFVIETIDLLSKAIKCFSIRKEEYEMEKNVVAIEEKMKLTNENAVLDIVLDEFFEKFPKSPIPSFNNITKLYKEIYDNWTIIIIGKLCGNEKKMISSIFTADINSNVDPLNNVLMKDLRYNRLCVHKKHNNQNMFFYVHSCNSTTTDIIAMKLIKYIYTNGLASVLYNKFVAEEGYCYSINFNNFLINNKFFVISFIYDCAPFEKMKEYIEKVFAIEFIDNMADKQYEMAKNMAITEAILKRERVSAILNDRVENYIFQQDITMTEEKINTLLNMSTENTRKLVKESLKPY